MDGVDGVMYGEVILGLLAQYWPNRGKNNFDTDNGSDQVTRELCHQRKIFCQFCNQHNLEKHNSKLQRRHISFYLENIWFFLQNAYFLANVFEILKSAIQFGEKLCNGDVGVVVWASRKFFHKIENHFTFDPLHHTGACQSEMTNTVTQCKHIQPTNNLFCL